MRLPAVRSTGRQCLAAQPTPTKDRAEPRTPHQHGGAVRIANCLASTPTFRMGRYDIRRHSCARPA
eukprot:14243146-Alexandrium_andersonii.AAC.1